MGDSRRGSPPASESVEPYAATPLPTELWFQVIVHLKPSHILALGQVCRKFRDIVCQKGPWVEALQSVCQRYGLLSATYPIDRMDFHHVRRAALGPDRYRRTIGRRGVLPQDLENAQPVPLVAPAHEWGRTLDYLVPGGRFLVTIPYAAAEEGDETKITIWDLGVPATVPPPSPVAVGNWSFRENAGRVRGVLGCVVNESRIRLMVRSQNENVLTLRVFTVFLGETSPLFEENASIRLAGELIGEKVMFTPEAIISTADMNTFLLWNYMHNQYATWSSKHKILFVPQLTYVDHYFVYFCPISQSLLVWDLAELKPHLRATPETSTTLNTSTERPANSLTELVIPCPWSITRKGSCDFPSGPTSSLFPHELVIGVPGTPGDVMYRWYAVDIASAWSKRPPSRRHTLARSLKGGDDEYGKDTMPERSEAHAPPQPPYRLLTEAQFPTWTVSVTSDSKVFFRSDGVCEILDFNPRSSVHRGGCYLFSPLSDDEDDCILLKIATPPERADYILSPVCQASGRAVSFRYRDTEGYDPYIRVLEVL